MGFTQLPALSALLYIYSASSVFCDSGFCASPLTMAWQRGQRTRYWPENSPSFLLQTRTFPSLPAYWRLHLTSCMFFPHLIPAPALRVSSVPGSPIGAASRQRSCTYSLMRQGLCQLSYSDMEPHLFRLSLLAAVLPSPHTWGNAAWLSVVSQLLSVCFPSGFHGWERPSVFQAVTYTPPTASGIGRSALFERDCRFWRPGVYLNLRPYMKPHAGLAPTPLRESSAHLPVADRAAAVRHVDPAYGYRRRKVKNLSKIPCAAGKR